MAKAETTSPPYTEAQVTRWLAFLASRMQWHGQTVFQIEGLQPTWLPSSRHRYLYFFASRLLAALVLVLAMWPGFRENRTLLPNPAAVLLAGLIAALLDTWRLRGGKWGGRLTRAPLIVRLIVYGEPAASIVGLVKLLLSMPVAVAELQHNGVTDPLAIIYRLFSFTVLLLGARDVGRFNLLVGGLLWGSRANRTLRDDIHVVETMSLSPSRMAIGGAAGMLLGAITGASWSGFLILEQYSGQYEKVLLLALVFGIAGAVVGAFKPGVVELKTAPNSGIRLSLRHSLVGGLRLGVVLGLGLTLYATRTQTLTGMFVSWAKIGLVTGTAYGLWLGGMDVIQHYTLRAILALKGYVPWNYVRFLDYAATQLGFLQKVGGGYIFIHRMLLEHFASLPDTPASTDSSGHASAPTTR